MVSAGLTDGADIAEAKNIKYIESIDNIRNINKNVHKKRFSDRNIFWLFVLLLAFLSHYYLYNVVGVELAFPWKAVCLIVGFLAIISSVAVRRLGAPRRVRRTISLQSAIYRFGACWNIFVVLTAIFMLAVHPFDLPKEGEFVVSCLTAFAICSYGVYEARTIHSTQFTLETEKISGRKLRIAHITDLHISPYMMLGHVRRVVNAVVEAEPDVVVITGDLVDGIVGGGDGVAPFYRPFATELRRLCGSGAYAPSLGVWAVPGNHDYYEGFGNSCDFMETASIELLSGEKRVVGPLTILGADDLDHLRRSRELPDLSQSEALIASLDEPEKNKFILLLRHRPVVEPSTIGRFDLQLSGHTHGGQLLTLPSSMHRVPGKPKGLRSLGSGSSLYVSNGAGFVGPPMRFLAPAEVVIIDLIPARQGGEAGW